MCEGVSGLTDTLLSKEKHYRRIRDFYSSGEKCLVILPKEKKPIWWLRKWPLFALLERNLEARNVSGNGKIRHA
jgi:hypothetical protein